VTRSQEKRLARHTPGPWSVEDPIDHELSIVEAGKPTHEWQFIACVPHGGKSEGDFPRVTAEANARLIAAAPELLEVLRIYAAYDEYINGVEGDPSTDRLQKAKAAIAKAEGRS
jgi:hypothetical protein